MTFLKSPELKSPGKFYISCEAKRTIQESSPMDNVLENEVFGNEWKAE